MSLESLEASCSFCQFREDCDYVSEFRCSRKKPLVDFLALLHERKSAKFICSFNLPKIMKTC